MLDRNLLKNHLYSTFVLLQTTEENDMTHVIKVEIIHEINITTKNVFQKTDIALHPEIDSVIIKVLLLHNTRDHDMTTKKRDSRSYRSPYISSFYIPLQT